LATDDGSSETTSVSIEMNPVNGSKRPAPKQDEIKTMMNDTNADIVHLQQKQRSGLITEKQSKELSDLFKKQKSLESDLRRLEGGQKRAKTHRDKKKDQIQSVVNQFPEASNILNLHESPGRPSLEADNPDLIQLICDIAIHGSSAQGRRRDDTINSVKTLSQLTEELRRRGLDISRSATYIRILPKRSGTKQARRHVNTAPVKLLKASNDQHQNHADGIFCTTTIRHLEQIASMLGPKEVIFMSQDDKARVSIGVTAAVKQKQMLMHLQYRVSLPDHDWVKASKHKLIPSVYGLMEIQENGLGNPQSVSYSGPTYIAVRSGKHSTSTALSHALDFERMLSMDQFDKFLKNGSETKPVLIMTVDGGPDENPR
jgi:hypothetical protein